MTDASTAGQAGTALWEAGPEHLGAMLAEQRRAIAQRVMDGASGAETIAETTDLVDD